MVSQVGLSFVSGYWHREELTMKVLVGWVERSEIHQWVAGCSRGR